jgi:hypothetical protein
MKSIIRSGALLGCTMSMMAACTGDSGSQSQDDTEWIGSNSVEVAAEVRSSLVHKAEGAYAELATDIELQTALVTTQITYAKPALEKSKYYLNMLPDSILDMQVSVDGDWVTIDYQARIDMVLPANPDTTTLAGLRVKNMDIALPLDPVDVFGRAGDSCASNYGSYILSEQKYFYYFDAGKTGCELEMSAAKVDVVEVYPNPTVYPEYDRLLTQLEGGQQGFRAAILPNRGDNDPMSRYQGHRNELNRRLKMQPEAMDGFERYRWTQGAATIVVDLFDPTDGWFSGDFHQALSGYQLVYYNGHSNYGNQPFLNKPEVYSDAYQIIGMHSCKSYSYYAHQVATGKATASDPSGWRNADMIATGRSSYPNDSPDVLAALLLGLMKGLRAVAEQDPNAAPSWQQIGDDMRAVAPSILYGVAGARNNVWTPEGGQAPVGDDPSACGHSLCEPGAALDPSCDPCAAKVIAEDAFCQDDSWDDVCVEQAVELCNLSCPGQS